MDNNRNSGGRKELNVNSGKSTDGKSFSVVATCMVTIQRLQSKILPPINHFISSLYKQSTCINLLKATWYKTANLSKFTKNMRPILYIHIIMFVCVYVCVYNPQTLLRSFRNIVSHRKIQTCLRKHFTFFSQGVHRMSATHIQT